MFIFMLLLAGSTAYGGKVDSLKSIIPNLERKQKIKTIKELIPLLPGKEKAHYYNLLGDLLQGSNYTASEKYLRQALDLLKKYPDKKEEAFAYSRLAWLYFLPKLKYDSSEYFALKAIDLIKDDTFYNVLAYAYNIAGISQADQGKLEEGLQYFKQAEKNYLKAKNYCKAATIHHNMGKLNKYSKGFEVVKKFFFEALEMYKKYNCEENYDFLYSNLADIYIWEGKYQKAKEMLEKVNEIAKRYNKMEGLCANNLSLGELYMHIDTSQARKYLGRALLMSDSLQYVKLQIAVRIDLADYYLKLNQPQKAKKYIDFALQKSKESHKLMFIQDAYERLTEYYKAIGDYKNAFASYQKHIAYKDSVDARKVRMHILSLENEKKENQIKLLNKENELIELKARKTRLYAYLTGLIFLLSLLIAYFYFRQYKNRQELKKMELENQSKNKLLKMERQLMSAIIETEDRERKRLSAEIHDGLGPMLIGIKLFFESALNSKGKEKKELLQQTKGLLETAIEDLRSISHNLVPETFSSQGLVKMLQSFVYRINFSKKIKIDFQHNYQPDKYTKAFEIIIYRIITELINNTIKHADASNIYLRLTDKNDKIVIEYADDGKGFDVEKVMNGEKSGLGLFNIKERVGFLGGKFEIKSKPGKGIKVYIELETQHHNIRYPSIA